MDAVSQAYTQFLEKENASLIASSANVAAYLESHTTSQDVHTFGRTFTALRPLTSAAQWWNNPAFGTLASHCQRQEQDCEDAPRCWSSGGVFEPCPLAEHCRRRDEEFDAPPSEELLAARAEVSLDIAFWQSVADTVRKPSRTHLTAEELRVVSPHQRAAFAEYFRRVPVTAGKQSPHQGWTMARATARATATSTSTPAVLVGTDASAIAHCHGKEGTRSAMDPMAAISPGQRQSGEVGWRGRGKEDRPMQTLSGSPALEMARRRIERPRGLSMRWMVNTPTPAMPTPPKPAASNTPGKASRLAGALGPLSSSTTHLNTYNPSIVLVKDMPTSGLLEGRRGKVYEFIARHKDSDPRVEKMLLVMDQTKAALANNRKAVEDVQAFMPWIVNGVNKW